MSILGLENINLSKRKYTASSEGFFSKLKEIFTGGPFKGKTREQIYEWGVTVIKGLNDEQWRKLSSLKLKILSSQEEKMVLGGLPGAYAKLVAIYKRIKANPPDMSDWDNLEKEEYDPGWEAIREIRNDKTVGKLMRAIDIFKPLNTLAEGKWTKNDILQAIQASRKFQSIVDYKLMDEITGGDSDDTFIHAINRCGESELDCCELAIRTFALKN